MEASNLVIGGREYVVMPKADYERLLARTGVAPEPEGRRAMDVILASLGRDLRLAREHAGLTQAALAKKLRKAQSTVSGSESGQIRVSERYVKAVLRACGLPEDWKPPAVEKP